VSASSYSTPTVDQKIGGDSCELIVCGQPDTKVKVIEYPAQENARAVAVRGR